MPMDKEMEKSTATYPYLGIAVKKNKHTSLPSHGYNDK